MQVLDWDTVCKRDRTEEYCVHATRNMIPYLISKWVKPEYTVGAGISQFIKLYLYFSDSSLKYFFVIWDQS